MANNKRTLVNVLNPQRERPKPSRCHIPHDRPNRSKTKSKNTTEYLSSNTTRSGSAKTCDSAAPPSGGITASLLGRNQNAEDARATRHNTVVDKTRDPISMMINRTEMSNNQAEQSQQTRQSRFQTTSHAAEQIDQRKRS